MTHFIHTPQVNVNEDDATLVEWFKKSGDYVRKGELLCSLETLKSTFDLHSEEEGYFVSIVEAGHKAKVGQVIAVLTEKKGQSYQIPSPVLETALEETQPVELNQTRWTKKAEIIAIRNQLNIEQITREFPTGQQITESLVNQYLDQKSRSVPSQVHPSAHSNQQERIMILGGGNVAVLVLDILTRIPRQTAVGILDDDPGLSGTFVSGCPVLGKMEEVADRFHRGEFDTAALAVGNLPARANLFEKFTSLGIPFTNIIDPSANIALDSAMGTGNMIMSFCRLGPASQIGSNNFLSAYVNIEHHNQMGDHCTFGPGVMMSGGVKIGSRVRFGTGVFVEPRLKIGDDVIIASNVVLTTHVPDRSIVRAKTNFTIHPL